MSHTVTEYGLRNFYESIKSLMKTNTKNKNLIQLQITASKRKRILFHLMGGFISGGSDRCLFSLLTQLDQSKYEPFLLYKKKSILVKQLQDMGIKLIPFPNHSKENAKSQLKKTVNNKRTKKKPNIIKILLGKSYFLYSLLSNSKILINAVPEILRLAKIVIVNRIDMIHANHNLNGDRAIILTAILLRKKITAFFLGDKSIKTAKEILEKNKIKCYTKI